VLFRSDFSYGVGSFARHCDAARRAGFDVEVFRDHALGFDVDHPADLDAMHDLTRAGAVQAPNSSVTSPLDGGDTP
jgi:2-phospho-L-lactate guanylyltransferase (CobY/MobA/RfbA family)